jgi:hypothetical protein
LCRPCPWICWRASAWLRAAAADLTEVLKQERLEFGRIEKDPGSNTQGLFIWMAISLVSFIGRTTLRESVMAKKTSKKVSKKVAGKAPKTPAPVAAAPTTGPVPLAFVSAIRNLAQEFRNYAHDSGAIHDLADRLDNEVSQLSRGITERQAPIVPNPVK